MTDEQILTGVINNSLNQICDELEFKEEEKERLRKTYWETYFNKAVALITEKSGHFKNEQSLSGAAIHFTDQLQKIADTIRQKYFDSETNIRLMLDCFFEFFDLTFANAPEDKRQKLLEIISVNFQL